MAWLETETHFFNPAVQFNTTVIETGLRSRLRACTRKREPSRLETYRVRSKLTPGCTSVWKSRWGRPNGFGPVETGTAISCRSSDKK